MQTKLSTRGQVVLPGPLRRRLGLRIGDSLEAKIEGRRIVLTPQRKRRDKARIVTDSVTGLPALSAGPDAPLLTAKEVREIIANFP